MYCCEIKNVETICGCFVSVLVFIFSFLPANLQLYGFGVSQVERKMFLMQM